MHRHIFSRAYRPPTKRYVFFFVNTAAPMMQCIKKPIFRHRETESGRGTKRSRVKKLQEFIAYNFHFVIYFMRLFISFLDRYYFFCLWTDILWWKMGHQLRESPILCTLSLCDRKKCKWKEHKCGKIIHCRQKKIGIKKEIRRTIKSFVLFMWCTHAFESWKKQRFIEF